MAYRYTQDQQLMEDLGRNDPAAWEYLFQEKKYFRLVRNFATRNSGSLSEAQDLFQEVLEVVAQKAAGLVLTCKFTTYLYSVTRKRWALYCRIHRKGTLFFRDTAQFVDLPDHDVLLDRQQAAPDQAMWQVLGQLGERCRDLLKDRYLNGHSATKLAATYNYADARSASSQLHRCLEKAREMSRLLDRS